MTTQRKIYVFTLADGSEHVAEGERLLNGKWQFYKPLKNFMFAAPAMTPQGPQMSIGGQFIPSFPMCGNTNFEVSEDKLLFTPVEAPKQYQDMWIQATSGIQIAKSLINH